MMYNNSSVRGLYKRTQHSIKTRFYFIYLSKMRNLVYNMKNNINYITLTHDTINKFNIINPSFLLIILMIT